MSDRTRNRRPYHGPRRPGGALASFLSRLDTKGSMRLVRLWRNWSEALSPDIARLIRPLGHRGTTLIVYADDPVVAQEAHFLGPMILENINTFLGEEVFDKVVFELLNGRVPLDGQPVRDMDYVLPKARKPGKIGGLLGKIDESSAFGRAYKKYVDRFAEKK